MGMILGGIKVTRSKPKISVRIVNNEESMESAELYLRRVGTQVDLIAYVPSLLTEDYVEFTFDEVLWVEPVGRYRASFRVNGVERTVFYIHYESEEVLTVVNAS